MKDYTQIWKELAHQKLIKNTDVLKHCLLRAMSSKRENKLESALYFVDKAYTPITNPNTLQYQGKVPYSAVLNASNNARFYNHVEYSKFVHDLRNCLETEEEKMIFNRLCSSIFSELDNAYDKQYYTYILVNRELSHEQMTVQAAHATFFLGLDVNNQVDYDKLNFVLIGSENAETLEGDAEYIYSCGYDSIKFYEPDFANKLTAIASYPIPARQRGFMKRYKTLNFEREQRAFVTKQIFSSMSDLSDKRD